ncbi:MAG: MqnA/MqnD/SBP family protein [bacterium]
MAEREANVGYVDRPETRFILHGLLKSRIESKLYEFHGRALSHGDLADELHAGQFDVAIISSAKYPHYSEQYNISTSGTRFVSESGPLVIGRQELAPEDVHDSSVAVPEETDVSTGVLRLWSDGCNLEPYPHDEIISVVEDGTVRAGVLRDRSYLNSMRTDLLCVIDLSQWWKRQTRRRLPIHIGIINSSRDDDGDLCGMLRSSIEHALENSDVALQYALGGNNDRKESTIENAINRTVTRQSLDMGSEGRASFQELYNRLYQNGFLSDPVSPVFVQTP